MASNRRKPTIGYDEFGNIRIEFDQAETTQPEELLSRVHRQSSIDDVIWNTIEPDEEIREPALQPIQNIRRTTAKTTKIFLSSVLEEGKQQWRETAHDAKRASASLLQSIGDIPAGIVQAGHNFWHMANLPCRVPTIFSRKPKERSRVQLFIIDMVSFGGTFALIFFALFFAINYQSFWQIAKAELALGDDSRNEMGLAEITEQKAATNPFLTFQPSFSRAKGDLLAYLPRVGPFQNRLIIPKIGKNVPIVVPPMQSLIAENWKQFEDDIQVALRGGVVHYPGSARPGRRGNFFVTGHSSYYPFAKGNYKDVFARLSALEVGDSYSVYYGGDLHMYRVVAKYEVSPNNVSVLDQPTDKRLSTLMTCTPVGTTLRRLIVRGEEIDPMTGQTLKVGEKSTPEKFKPLKLDALPI